MAEALDDGDRDATWWYDPSTGQVEPGVSEWMADEFGDDDEPEDRGLVPIESHRSRAAYDDIRQQVGLRRIEAVRDAEPVAGLPHVERVPVEPRRLTWPQASVRQRELGRSNAGQARAMRQNGSEYGA